MFGKFHRSNGSHIPYSPVEELSDGDLSAEIFAIQNASDVLPRKRALREERIARHISDIGLDQAEALLGIESLEEVNNG